MSHLLIVKRLELYMDLALYKINILLLLLLWVAIKTKFRYNGWVGGVGALSILFWILLPIIFINHAYEVIQTETISHDRIIFMQKCRSKYPCRNLKISSSILIQL